MLNSYKQLTVRYLKANRKRSILTIIGIILSVALVSSIGLFLKALQESQIDQARATYGSAHLMFKKTNDSLISKVANNPKVSRYGLYGVGDEIKVKDDFVAYEVKATDKALELLPYKPKEGRLPEKENEVAVEKWVLSYVNKKANIGDEISFNNKDYRLVGILEDSIQNQIEHKGVLLTKSNNIDRNKAVLLVEVSSKTNLKKGVQELEALGEKDTVKENSSLLLAQGVNNNRGAAGLFVVIGIIVTIVVISTIAVIYNSFQISVVERIKQFGLLRAVGSTPKQIRKIVLREATILATIGVPVGLLFGVIAIYGISLAFKLIGGSSIFAMKVTLDSTILLLSALVGLISIYLSALLPAIFAGRISPLVAISSRTSITKEKIKRSKNKVIQRLFGFEGAMAAKNIKRSRKRYRITVFSIVISVVLFVAFKSFMDMALTVSTNVNESKDIHFSIVRDNEATRQNTPIEDSTIKELQKLNTVDSVYKVYDAYDFEGAINSKSRVKEIDNIGNVYRQAPEGYGGKSLIDSWVEVYDEPSLETSKKYLQAGNISVEELNKNNGVILINKNIVPNARSKKDYYGPIADIKVGDEIELQYRDFEKESETRTDFGKGEVKKVKVMAILDNDPFNFRGAQNGLKLITTDEVAKKLTGKKDIMPINLNIKIKNIKAEETAKSEIEAVIKSNPSLMLVNNIDNNRRTKTSLLMVQILMYGFVTVVSLIGSVNIINTLTTNIILRKREFAALKSIGLTQRGLKKMIVLEGLFYGIVGTVYGAIIGCGLSYLMFRGFNGVRELGWSIPWNAIGIAGAAALVIGYLSVLSPLARIKRENLIDAIREDF